MDLTERIVTDPAICSGRPCIKGTRLSVEFLLGCKSAGWSDQQILDSYPHISAVDLQAVFAYARAVLQNESWVSAASPGKEGMAGAANGLPEDQRFLARIVINPAIFGGKPIIRGRRIAVEHILGMLAAGDSPETILTGYPFLESEDIQACLLYARRMVGGERVDLVIIRPPS